MCFDNSNYRCRGFVLIYWRETGNDRPKCIYHRILFAVYDNDRYAKPCGNG